MLKEATRTRVMVETPTTHKTPSSSNPSGVMVAGLGILILGLLASTLSTATPAAPAPTLLVKGRYVPPNAERTLAVYIVTNPDGTEFEIGMENGKICNWKNHVPIEEVVDLWITIGQNGGKAWQNVQSEYREQYLRLFAEADIVPNGKSS